LKRAIKYLEDVLEHRDCIPYRRFTGHVGRTTQAKLHGVTQGRFPEKSVRHVLQLLKNLSANSEAKGLDVERTYISHFAVQRAIQEEEEHTELTVELDPTFLPTATSSSSLPRELRASRRLLRTRRPSDLLRSRLLSKDSLLESEHARDAVETAAASSNRQLQRTI
jgi:hypothetical protein